MEIKNIRHVQITLMLLLGTYDVKGRSEDVLKGDSFCHWKRVSVSGHTYHSFVQHSGGTSSGSVLLFHSTWTEDQRLVDCVVSDELTVIEDYLSICRSKRAGEFTDALDQRVNISRLFASRSPCTIPLAAIVDATQRLKRHLQVDEQSQSDNQSHDVSIRKQSRMKRSWVFPGTLWCGWGNKAASNEELGVFKKTDRCCREHDQCEQYITSFSLDYGLFNRNIYTISHCDCDHIFHQCLLGVNNSISNMVGYTYFNLLKVQCFVLEQTEQCTEKSWWGMCSVSKLIPLAVLRNATTYNSTHPVQEDKKPDLSAVPKDFARDELKLVTQAMPTIAFLGQTASQTQEASPTPSSRWDRLNNQENALPAASALTEDVVPSNHLRPVQNMTHKGKRKLCNGYRHLDKCAYKILPGEERFGLRNVKSRTLYHCKCTRRLALQLSRLVEPDTVDLTLLDSISSSCFKLPCSKDRSVEIGCTAYLSKAPPLLRAIKQWGDAAQELPSNKVKRQKSEGAKGKRPPVRLFQRCLRLSNSSLQQAGQGGSV